MDKKQHYIKNTKPTREYDYNTKIALAWFGIGVFFIVMLIVMLVVNHYVA